MGQEASTPVDENTPTRTLSGRSLEAVAEYINSGRARRIVLMVGAGISTSAGIPDFRSPDTGLYANLATLNLPYPEAVFDISFFRNNPLPFYTLARELYPGRYRPTVAHSFAALLESKGLLLKLFTQNIDCLERAAGVSAGRIVEAHGSFASQSCIECQTSYPDDLMRRCVEAGEVPHCREAGCDGLVKPAIVFFGEQLPAAFFANRHLPSQADLCLVMGTSLTVQPFASLPNFCEEGCPRVLVNQERVGTLGSRPDDVLLLGACDDGVRRLAAACGWSDELEEMWAQTALRGPDGELIPVETVGKEEAEDEVEKLAREVGRTLKLAEANRSWLEKALEKKNERIEKEGVDARPEKAMNGEEKASPALEKKKSSPAEQSTEEADPKSESTPVDRVTTSEPVSVEPPPKPERDPTSKGNAKNSHGEEADKPPSSLI